MNGSVNTGKRILIIAITTGLYLIGAVASTALEVTIQWDKNPADENVTHYRVYYSTDAADLGNLFNLTTYDEIPAEPPDAFDSMMTHTVKGLGDDIVCPQRLYFGITALNTEGESPVSELVDTLAHHPQEFNPPAEPVLEVSQFDNNSVTLMWDKPLDDVCVVRFEIIRDSQRPVSIAATIESRYTYTDTGLEPEKSYTYVLRAYDGAGDFSETDPALTVTTASDPLEKPGKVEYVATAAQAYNRVRISWSPRSADEQVTDYKVHRTGGGPSRTFTVNIGTDYLDDSVQAETAYQYTVCAVNGAGEGPWSDPAAVTTPAPPQQTPGKVENPAADAQTHNRVHVTWHERPVDEQVTSYKIRRAGGGSPRTVTVDRVNTYSDVSVQPETAYEYFVCAVNGAGEGPWSDPAAVTTPAASKEETENTGGLEDDDNSGDGDGSSSGCFIDSFSFIFP